MGIPHRICLVAFLFLSPWSSDAFSTFRWDRVHPNRQPGKKNPFSPGQDQSACELSELETGGSPNGTVYAQLQVGEGNWMDRARQLLAYKEANGHTRVPKRFKENPALGNWVNKQRQHYRNYLAGTKPCSLNDERIGILNQLGFCWNAAKNTKERHHDDVLQTDDSEWWNNFRECQNLAQQEQINARTVNDTLCRAVPQKSHPGRWLQRQRQVYQQQQQQQDANSKSESSFGVVSNERLSDEQLQALRDFDPDWWMSHREWQWEVRYRELQDYARTHGDCCVPISHSNRQLAHFVSNQRKQYNLKKRGKPCNLTDERMERLNAIHFVWNRWEYEFSKKQELWKA